MGSRLISKLRNSSPIARHGAASFKRAESAIAATECLQPPRLLLATFSCAQLATLRQATII
jgi:hypothetical protein